jgi:hypothetical protein
VSLGARLPASITDYDEHRHTLEHLLDNNTYMPRAVDRSLPVDVSYLHLSSHGLCLADSVLSQQSASPQLRLFRYLSCHVFAIANRRFSQRSSSPEPVAAPYSVVPPWALNLLFLGWLRVRGSWGNGCCSGLAWLLAFVVFTCCI